MSQKFIDFLNDMATLSPLYLALYAVAALIGYVIGVHILGVIFPK